MSADGFHQLPSIREAFPVTSTAGGGGGGWIGSRTKK